MCGHFALDYTALVDLLHTYALEEEAASFSMGEFFPSHGPSHKTAPILLRTGGKWNLRRFWWDLIPSWWDRPLEEKVFPSFNARSESLAEKPVFRKAWHNRQRALVPATAFYEWPDRRRLPPGIRRREHRIHLVDRSFFTMAALWDVWVDPKEKKPLYSFALITTPANRLVAALPHDRMPAILLPEFESMWVDPKVPPEEAIHLLTPYPEMGMTYVPVGDEGSR